jgi:cytoskeletal protein CcmA (bactofilin family)
MTMSISIMRWALLALLLGLLSCSGGTGGTGIDDQPERSVVVFGAVTNFGSVVVNGIAFDTTDAAITLNGQRGSAADLQLGHIVTVRGTLDPSGIVGTADTVAAATQARGAIASIDPATNRLVVLGQIVRVHDTTQFGATPLNALSVGNIVELSGFADADGVLRATRVDKTQDTFTPGTELKREGLITDLDAANQTFMLNTLRVDFAAAQLLNLPDEQLRAGQMVEVKSTQNLVADVLFADSVEVKAVGIRGNPGEAIEFQGIITQVLAADTFEVNGQVVRFTPTTVFAGGTATDIAVNMRVEIEGFFDAAGTVVAEEVELDAEVERQGFITRVIAADTFEVNGQVVRLTPTTMFEGGTAADIAVDVFVKIEGSLDATGVLVATEISFFVEIRGLITRVISADTFEIDGQVVRLTPATVFEEGTAADIAVNVPVEVEGLFDATGVLVAAEIEFLQ